MKMSSENSVLVVLLQIGAKDLTVLGDKYENIIESLQS